VKRAAAVALLGLLAACGGEDAVTPTCDAVACLERTLTGHTQRVTSVAFTRDSLSVVTGSVDGTVRLWTVADGLPQRTFTSDSTPVLSVAVAPDGALIAGGTESARVQLWRTADGVLVRSLDEASFGITSLAFSSDGRTLLAASNDHKVRLYDIDSGRLLQALDAHAAPVDEVALSQDEHAFATAGGILDARVRLWAFPAGTDLWTGRSATETAYWSLAFAPNGVELAAGGTFGDIHLYSVADGHELRTLTAGDGVIESLAYSPDGLRLFATEGDNVRVLDPASGSSLGLLAGHTGIVFSLAVSRDGTRLASASDDGTARLWSLD
jgi:WD40 repeat protein